MVQLSKTEYSTFTKHGIACKQFYPCSRQYFECPAENSCRRVAARYSIIQVSSVFRVSQWRSDGPLPRRELSSIHDDRASIFLFCFISSILGPEIRFELKVTSILSEKNFQVCVKQRARSVLFMCVAERPFAIKIKRILNLFSATVLL